MRQCERCIPLQNHNKIHSKPHCGQAYHHASVTVFQSKEERNQDGGKELVQRATLIL